jgi:hypothetical protein
VPLAEGRIAVHKAAEQQSIDEDRMLSLWFAVQFGDVLLLLRKARGS